MSENIEIPYFSKEELLECSNETYEKLKIHLPKCKKDIHINMGQDDWGVKFISYGNEDEMHELINLILEWKTKAQLTDSRKCKT